MPYVIVGPLYAEQLSRSIMRLLRPSHLRGQDWTDFYCRIITHPTSGAKAIELPDGELAPLHPDATASELRALLAVFVADGSISQREADGMAEAALANAGSRVRIADFVPDSWKRWVMTRAEMQAGGWFPHPDPM